MADEFSSQIANAFVLFELGDLAVAANTLEHQLDALACAPPSGVAAEVATVATLCGKLIHSGQTMQIPFLRKLCSMTSRCIGAEHPMSISAELQLASALLIQGDHDDAEKTAMELLDRCERILGKDNQLTVQCALILIGVYSRKEDIVSGQNLLARIPGLKDALLIGQLGA
jgi:hypothetical protein